MNKFFAILIGFILSMSFSEHCVAKDGYQVITLFKQENHSIRRIKVNEDDKGNRFVAVTCTVSQENGVEISGTTDEIISYEIWDATGTVCIAYFTNEEEFVEYLFSLNGDFQLVFFFEDYTLIGEITVD